MSALSKYYSDIGRIRPSLAVDIELQEEHPVGTLHGLYVSKCDDDFLNDCSTQAAVKGLLNG